jgi:hypothetical protein
VTYLNHEPTPPYAPSNPRASLILSRPNQTQISHSSYAPTPSYVLLLDNQGGHWLGARLEALGCVTRHCGTGDGEHSEGRLLINSAIPPHFQGPELAGCYLHQSNFWYTSRNSDSDSGSLVYSVGILRYYALSPTLDPNSE